MTKLLLVRHGITKQNMKGLFIGRTDVELDKIGIRQAIALSKSVHKEFLVDIIYTSPLKRAYETAKKIKGKKNVPLIQSDLLVEMDFGDWEGRSHEEIFSLYPKEYVTWEKTPNIFNLPSGETLDIIKERSQKAFHQITTEHTEKTICIVSHGVWLRVAICYLTGKKLEDINEIPWLDNTSLSIIEIESGNIIRMNDIQHLNPAINPVSNYYPELIMDAQVI